MTTLKSIFFSSKRVILRIWCIIVWHDNRWEGKQGCWRWISLCILQSPCNPDAAIFSVLQLTYRQLIWVISNHGEWSSDSECHEGIKDISEWVGQQLCGGSAASMGPGGLVSNQSGFDVYWQHIGLNWTVFHLYSMKLCFLPGSSPMLWIWQKLKPVDDSTSSTASGRWLFRRGEAEQFGWRTLNHWHHHHHHHHIHHRHFFIISVIRYQT